MSFERVIINSEYKKALKCYNQHFKAFNLSFSK